MIFYSFKLSRKSFVLYRSECMVTTDPWYSSVPVGKHTLNNKIKKMCDNWRLPSPPLSEVLTVHVCVCPCTYAHHLSGRPQCSEGIHCYKFEVAVNENTKICPN